MMLRLGDHCGHLLADLGEADERISVLDGDLADSDGAVHFARRYPDRFFMAGIAEQSMVSMAAGMASCGLRPFVFSFAAFLAFRAYDQIRVCLSQAKQPVTLIGSHSGGLSGRNGKTHVALNDITLMASLPHMQVWAPGDPDDVRLAVRSALDGSEPCYLRLPRKPLGDLPGNAAPCRWIGDPSSVVLLGTGLGTHLAAAAQTTLALRGQPVGLLHCPRIAPLPIDALIDLVRDVSHLFVIEDHTTFGGLGTLLRESLTGKDITIKGWSEDWSGESGTDEKLLHAGGLDAESIANLVVKTLTRRRT